MPLKRNVLANYAGQGWRALMGIAFAPIYVEYLGIEAYGLVGIFAILQAWLALLDLGMKPALSREMARFTAGAHDAQWIANLLRSVEIIVTGVAVTVIFVALVSAEWVASVWLNAGNLPPTAIAQALAIMGAVIGFRFIEDTYTACLIGLQHQVLVNAIISVMATFRAVGAIAILAFVSNTIAAFFIWQGIISAVTLVIAAVAVYTMLPRSPERPRFTPAVVRESWRFAAGMTVITLLALVLTQVDKIMLSKLLTLERFGYYAFAGVVTNALFMLSSPISVAIYPRFVELAAAGDETRLRTLYHEAAQLIAVVMGSAAIMLMVFGNRILLVWTGDATLTTHVAPLVAVLAFGTLLNGLMSMPYHLQLAHGWTSLAVRVNVAAVCVLIPLILWLVPRFGALGAALAWVLLNLGYMSFFIFLMHRRLLPDEMGRWYARDVAFPLIAGVVAASLCRWLLPAVDSIVVEALLLMFSAACVIGAAAAASDRLRNKLATYLAGRKVDLC